MKILITGGTGLIGSELIKYLAHHSIVLLTRDPVKAKQQLAHLTPNYIEFISDLDCLKNLDDFDAVINLAGEPIADKRWGKTQKNIICNSRWELTQHIADLFNVSSNPPETFISASAIGYYGNQNHHIFDESLRVENDQFAHKVCARWEQIAQSAQSSKTRVCLLRTGIVLSSNRGALQKMLLPYKFGLGGPIGRGEQYMPWIHILDMVMAIVFILEHPMLHGPINVCSPHPVTNRTFSETLANTLQRPHLLFIPAWLISLIMGESASLLLDSIRANPKKLTQFGYEFQFPRLDQALKQLIQS
jgi:uncharacterized protein